MYNTPNGGFSDRLKASAEARKALLSKFQPKPTVVAEVAPDRAAERAAELEKIRAERKEAKAAKALAVVENAQAQQEALDAAAAAALDAKRGERKERKALSKAVQKGRRDARYAARKARN
jgi:hypothetical protein